MTDAAFFLSCQNHPGSLLLRRITMSASLLLTSWVKNLHSARNPGLLFCQIGFLSRFCCQILPDAACVTVLSSGISVIRPAGTKMRFPKVKKLIPNYSFNFQFQNKIIKFLPHIYYLSVLHCSVYPSALSAELKTLSCVKSTQ